MTADLTYLAWTLLLAVVQILLFAAARTREYGARWNTGPRDEAMPPLSRAAGRLQRAQDNLYETLPLFIGAVLIAHVAGKADQTTALGAAMFFWARVAYVPLYLLGAPIVRTLVWAVSLAGLGLILAPLLSF